MTTATLTRPTVAVPGVTQARVIRSEWTKFRSLRSSWWTMAVAVVLTIGIGALFAALLGNHYNSLSAGEKATFDPVATGFNGITFAELAIGVLGVMLVSGEYGTGMIRASLTVVPRRTPVLWAKLAVLAAITFVTMLVTSFVTFLLTQAILDSHHLGASLSAPGALRSVVGAALFLTVSGIIGLTLGALLRSTAAGISTYVGVFFVLTPLAQLLPGSWSTNIGKVLPGNAGADVYSVVHSSSDLGPWTGFAVFCAYAVVLIVAAAAVLRRRDA